MPQEKQEHTMRTLLETNPEAGPFVGQLLLIAQELMGNGTENELTVAMALVNTLYRLEITGSELSRLQEYTNGDAEKAYDVLTVESELKKFKSSNN